MKFEINRLEMLTAAKHAKKIAPTNSPVDLLNGILIECNDDKPEVFLTATNHETSIQCKVKASVSESGSMLIHAGNLADILTLLPGEHVEFSAVKPEILQISGGKAVYKLLCLSANHYPKPVMPFPEEAVKMSGVCSLYKKTAFSASKDEHKGALKCVSVKMKGGALHASSCDGMKMMLVKGTTESMETREFMLPVSLFAQLAAVSTDKDVYEVGDIGKEIVFTKENMMFSMRKTEGTPMDPMTVLKTFIPKYSATVDVKRFRDALDTMAAGAGTSPVKLSFADNIIQMTRNGEFGASASNVPAIVKESTPDTGFHYNLSWLLKALSVFEDKIKVDIDANGFLVIKTVNEVYLQLPIYKPAEEKTKTDNAAEPAKEAA